MRKRTGATASLCALFAIIATTSFAQSRGVLAEQAQYSAPVQRLQDAPGASKLTPVGADGHAVHIFPTVQFARRLGLLGDEHAPPTNCSPCTPLLYHSGGKVMQPFLNFYIIYWVPPHLQNGGATSMPALYMTIQKNMIAGYFGHPYASIDTQYYQTVGSTRTYITGTGTLAGTATINTAYPASGCTDTATPGNCITDAQLRTEIRNVMTAKGWTGGLNKMFLLFTSSGEGSCHGGYCAYTAYCGYHGYIAGSLPVVYANMPYGNVNDCSPGEPSPNSDPVADVEASIAAHEATEAITDPELDAWYDSSSSEIGDKCAPYFGTATWDSAKANQMWGGHYFELQEMFDNHTLTCEQAGP